jgi:hypothetical protein
MAYTPIDKSDDYFNTITYTGDGTTKSITGVGFQPDWVWVKRRNGTTPHVLYDAVRGTGKQLISNDSSVEATNNQYGYISDFESDGFEVTVGSTSITRVNGSGGTYVAWNWLGANGTASNTDGSITSTVSANTTSGFSIVSYTGNSTSNATVGHGLGVTPGMIIVKNRDDADNWRVWHQGLSGSTYYVGLNQSNAESSSSTVFNGQSSTTFTIGNDPAVNQNTENIIAYCFAEKKGFSKFGSYTGNGSTDGTFVYTGFKPAFVMVKNTGAAENWIIFDNKRPGYNLTDALLKPNLSNAESTTGVKFDLLSNGFKARVSDAEGNSSGGNFIYMAFAENPFVTSTGIPTPAR